MKSASGIGVLKEALSAGANEWLDSVGGAIDGYDTITNIRKY